MRPLYHIHIAVLLFSFAIIGSKIIPLPAELIVRGRVLFSSIALGSYILWRRESFVLRRQDMFWVLALGGLLSLQWFSIFHAAKISSIAIATFSFASYPFFTVLLQPFFDDSTWEKSYLMITALVLLGIFLLVDVHSTVPNLGLGLARGLLGGLAFALYSIGNKHYVQYYDSRCLSRWGQTISIVLLAPFLFLYQRTLTPLLVSELVLLGVVCTAVAHTMFIAGLRGISSQKASILTMLQPVYATIIAVFLFAEIPTLCIVLGGLIVILAAMLIMRDKH